MNEIQESVLSILQETNPDINCDESVHLVDDGMIDSFDIVNLVLEFGEKFHVEIDAEEVIPENFQNVFTISELIRKNLKKNG